MFPGHVWTVSEAVVLKTLSYQEAWEMVCSPPQLLPILPVALFLEYKLMIWFGFATSLFACPSLQDEVFFTKWVLKSHPQISFILFSSNLQRAGLGTLLKSLVVERFPFKFRHDHVGNGRKEWRSNLDQRVLPYSLLGIWKSLSGSKYRVSSYWKKEVQLEHLLLAWICVVILWCKCITPSNHHASDEIQYSNHYSQRFQCWSTWYRDWEVLPSRSGRRSWASPL